MELVNNGAGQKSEPAKEQLNGQASQNGAAKPAAKAAQPANGKPEAEKPKAEPAKVQHPQAPSEPAAAEPAKPVMSLEEKLKVLNDLHRRSIQRFNLVTRIKQLEAFEVNLASENDELNDNPYQGCKLIIRDDKNRDFITTTPGLIRKVAEYIHTECHAKLHEIEATINFPAL